MAARDNTPTISFFSFQDIITSVTGIMFLVVIMLVLVVLQQSQSSASRRKSQELQKELTALEEEMGRLRDSLARLRRQSAAQNERIRELQKLRIETLPELKQKRIAELRAVDDSIRQLEKTNERILQRQAKQLELRTESEIVIRRNRDTIAERRQNISALDEEIKRQKKLYDNVKNVIRFVWNKSNLKRPVMVECGEKEISVNSLDGSIPRRVFTNYGDCMAYCRTFPAESTYFVLLLKPSAFAYGEEFSGELQRAGFERGREILPDEQTLITGEMPK